MEVPLQSHDVEVAAAGKFPGGRPTQLHPRRKPTLWDYFTGLARFFHNRKVAIPDWR